LSSISSITHDIKIHFDFLFAQGFKIQSISPPEYNMGNWLAVLESPACLLRLINDQGELLLDAGPKSQGGPQSWFSFNGIVFYITQGQVLLTHPQEGRLGLQEQYQSLADLLKSYLDEILPILGEEYARHEENLQQAMKDVSRLYREKLKQNNSGQRS
jgi:hypothetical protein